MEGGGKEKGNRKKKKGKKKKKPGGIQVLARLLHIDLLTVLLLELLLSLGEDTGKDLRILFTNNNLDFVFFNDFQRLEGEGGRGKG